MKRLLRGVIDFDNGKTPQEILSVSYNRLSHADVDWNPPSYDKIFKFVKAFFERQYELPSGETVRDHFQRLEDLETLEHLKDIAAAQVYVRTNYAQLLETILEDQAKLKADSVLKEVREVIQKGLVIGKGRDQQVLKGVKDGLLYFNQQIQELIPPDSNAITRGDLHEDGQGAIDEYQKLKVSKDRALGKFTGLEAVDSTFKGCRPGELHIHAGAPGELKTTFALNWCYNLVTKYKSNVFYVSMEMPYEDLRRQIYVMHSAHPKFTAMGRRPLDYDKVRNGELSPEEEEFYYQVVADFCSYEEHCRFEVWSPDRNVTLSDIRVEAELVQKQMDIGLLVLDHSGLIESSSKDKDYTIRLNTVIRDSKLLALHFNGGQKVPILMLHQINRTGKSEASKGESRGKYNMSALSYANEAEKSADYITSTFLDDELRQQNRTIIGCLKSRHTAHFPPTQVRVDFPCRRLWNFDPTSADASDMGAEGIEDIANQLYSV